MASVYVWKVARALSRSHPSGRIVGEFLELRTTGLTAALRTLGVGEGSGGTPGGIKRSSSVVRACRDVALRTANGSRVWLDSHPLTRSDVRVALLSPKRAARRTRRPPFPAEGSVGNL